MKLANQVSKIIVLILTVVFVALILITVLFTSISLSNAVDSSVELNSQNTALQIQNIFEKAESAAEDMAAYLQKAYSLQEKGFSNMAGEIIPSGESRKYKSIIYDKEISELNSDVEKYLTETARTTVLSSDAIDGMGAMFEQYCYDKNIEYYSFYIDEGISRDGPIEPFGDYSEYSQEVYYKDALETGKALFTEPYEYEGKLLITYAVPIQFEGKPQGVIMADIDNSTFKDAIQTDTDYPSMYTALYNSKFVCIFDSSSSDNIGQTMDSFYKNQKELQSVKDKMAEGKAFTYETTREDGRKIARYFTPFKAGDEIWWSMTALNLSEKNRATTMTVIILLVVSVISLAVIVIAVMRVLKKKIQPIESVVSAAEQIAHGDLDIAIAAQSKDEIGKLAEAFQTTADGLKDIIGDMGYLLQEMAEGNFAVKSLQEGAYRGAFGKILISTKKLNENMSKTLHEIADASNQVSTGAENMAEASENLAEGATEQAGAVEELLATITDLTEGIENTVEQVDHAYEMAEQYAKKAKEGSQEMQGLVTTMERISETSKKVGGIIGEIEEIASQTNLLSLNASIEAARAGEAGKGFAVVADQIGKLADESAQSAVNTRELITSAINEIEEGFKAVTKTAETLKEIIAGITQVAQSSKSVSELSRLQADAMRQAKTGVNQISEVVQSNSATAQEASATSEELSAESISLDELVNRFKLG